jgi:pyridoxal phosphate enzyme (YggS family)
MGQLQFDVLGQIFMSKISDRLTQVEDKVNTACANAGRARENVRIIVVTKTASVEDIKEVIKLGYRDFGENRVQNLKQVSAAIDEYLRAESDSQEIAQQINWHMIGHLQRNKVKSVLKIASLIQSVDTLRLAEVINEIAGKLGIRSHVLLQVNCSEEPQKYGVPVGAATHLAEQIMTMKNIRMEGLMTMAPLALNKDVVRSCFVRAKELFDEIKDMSSVNGFNELSMGMSQDYEIAIEEGATLLRIGSAIFAG